MLGRFQSGIAFAKQSFAIIKQKKSLMLFPLISGISTLVVFALIMVPAGGVLVYQWDKMHEQALTNTQWGILIGSFVVFLFIATFITLFFNAALTACALQFLKGGDCKLSDGLKAALRRIHVIFMWSLVMTTVGLAIQIGQTLLERWPVLEMIFGTLASLVWSIATFFVVPTLIVENMSPIKAIKRSSHLIKSTWGTSLVSYGSIGLLILVAFVISVLPLALGIHLGGSTNVGTGLVVTVVLVIGVMLFSSTMQTILKSGLYLYASGDASPGAYDEDLLKNAFRPKKQRAL